MPVLVAPVPDFYGHTIFCDDIRAEVDGKFTFVGVYFNHLMVVHAEFPIILPKFCIGVAFNQRNSLFNPDLKLRVVMPGDDENRPSIEADMPLSEVPPHRKPDKDNPDTDYYTQLGSNVIFSPFTIDKPGRIKVRIVREHTTYRLGSLRVMHISEANASNVPQPTSEQSPPSAPAT